MNRTAEKAAKELRIRGYLGDAELTKYLEPAVADIIERACGQDVELTEMRACLERERTKVAEGVTAVKKALDARHWLTEGRGSYEWDDDRWHGEFLAAGQEILQALKPLESIARDFGHCPSTQAEIAAARAEERPCGETATIPTAERATGRSPKAAEANVSNWGFSETVPVLLKVAVEAPNKQKLGDALADAAEKMMKVSSGGWTERAEVDASIVEWREAAEAPGGQQDRAINLLVGVRDSAVTDDGLCVICREDPHASGCVMTLVENYIHELDDAELATPAAPSERADEPQLGKCTQSTFGHSGLHRKSWACGNGFVPVCPTCGSHLSSQEGE